MKLMTIVGTRPEIIKLSQSIQELDKYMTQVLVHTGQNYDYELNEVFFQDLGIRKPDYFLDAATGNTAQTIGNIIVKADEVMEKEKPDAVLVYGDTNSCLSVIAAKRRKIPVFHMEAGNRCFDQRVPEEINRKIVDHLSDVNMVITEHARRYLIAEGIKPETIIKTGSSMKEIINKHQGSIDASKVLEKLALEEKKFIAVSAHREENIDSEVNFTNLRGTLEALAQEFKIPIIVSTHPRTLKRIEDAGVSFDSLIQLHKPFGFFDYLQLQRKAYCVVSDSGTITEESSILGFPAVTIRNSHERPEGMDEGTLIMCGLEEKQVMEAVKVTVTLHTEAKPSIVPDYSVSSVSMKVVKIILSYTRYIQREVWKIQQ